MSFIYSYAKQRQEMQRRAARSPTNTSGAPGVGGSNVGGSGSTPNTDVQSHGGAVRAKAVKDEAEAKTPTPKPTTTGTTTYTRKTGTLPPGSGGGKGKIAQ